MATAYLHAVALATPLWEKIDATIASQGDITHRNDLMSEVHADTVFRNALRKITFPPTVRSDATALIAALDDYVSFLTTAYVHDGYLVQHITEDQLVNETRARASGRLREDLNLPQSTCAYRRP